MPFLCLEYFLLSLIEKLFLGFCYVDYVNRVVNIQALKKRMANKFKISFMLIFQLDEVANDIRVGTTGLKLRRSA